MRYQKIARDYMLRIDQGELIQASLREFCNQHEIVNATVSGIGAVEWVRCGYYDLTAREYRFTEYDDEVVEVTSYLGNIMKKEDTIFVHAHATFSDTQNTVFGGHVDEMRVGVVLEVVVCPLPSTITRTFDENTGLYLMDI